MRSLAFVAFAFLGTIVPSVFSQNETDSSTSLLLTMPKCGLTCLGTAVASQTVCSATNTTCVCQSAQINANAAACVSTSCSILDSLSTNNVSSLLCGAPVRNGGPNLATTSIILAVFSYALVALRFAYKQFIGQDFWWDDWSLALLILAAIPSLIIITNGTVPNGLGQDIWKMRPAQVTNFIYYLWYMEMLYFIQIGLLKLTLLCFYLRIFPGPKVRLLLWGTIAVNIAWTIAFVFIAIFQCSPISYFWTNWDGLHSGQCLSANAIMWSNAGISIVLDVWMLAIPLWQVRSLNMSWKKKASVAAMFIVGTFVTVVSIVRLQTLTAFANTQNPTWDYLAVSVWSTVEINVGIFCACMPVLRLILVRYIPMLGGTENRSTTYKNASESRPTISKLGRSMRKSTQDSSRKIPQNSIMYQQSYTVQYSDETNLVQLPMQDLPARDTEKREKH